MGAPVIIKLPWRQGPVADVTGPVVISATKFTYKHLHDLPAVFVAALRLLRGWRTRPGAIGVLVGGEPWKRITYSMSVWTSEEDLRLFVRAPDHQPLLRRYRPRLEASISTVWETDHFVPDEAWREALRRLGQADPQESQEPIFARAGARSRALHEEETPGD
jgi:hypothetical protein